MVGRRGVVRAGQVVVSPAVTLFTRGPGCAATPWWSRKSADSGPGRAGPPGPGRGVRRGWREQQGHCIQLQFPADEETVASPRWYGYSRGVPARASRVHRRGGRTRERGDPPRGRESTFRDCVPQGRRDRRISSRARRERCGDRADPGRRAAAGVLRLADHRLQLARYVSVHHPLRCPVRLAADHRGRRRGRRGAVRPAVSARPVAEEAEAMWTAPSTSGPEPC